MLHDICLNTKKYDENIILYITKGSCDKFVKRVQQNMTNN